MEKELLRLFAILPEEEKRGILEWLRIQSELILAETKKAANG